MNVVRLGPLALPVDVLLFLASFLFALALAKYTGPADSRQQTEDWVWRLLVGSVLCSRLGFIAQYSSIYAAQPLSFLDIRDGGFDARFGFAFLAVGAFGLTLWRRSVGVRLAIISVVTMAVWFGGNYAARALGPKPADLPMHSVRTLQGQVLSLDQLKGRPTVINLWASWCPPCRREMPVFQAAQAQYNDVVFIFINQGESASQVISYLQSESLVLNNLYLDSRAEVGKLFNAPGLPTTLYFDSQGREVARRMGEVSHASLLANLKQIREIDKSQ